MSELDDKRIQNFLDKMKKNQVIITCTDRIKIENEENKFFKIENGKILKTN